MRHGRHTAWFVLAGLLGASGAIAAEWLRRVPLEQGSGTIAVTGEAPLQFLRFGGHSFEPTGVRTARGETVKVEHEAPVLIAPFQQLWAVGWRLPKTMVTVERPAARDAFWDQVLVVDRGALGELPRYPLSESGGFGAALAPALAASALSAEEIARQQASLADPVIQAALEREMGWDELAAKALPLDFQKVLIAEAHDGSPAFAFQNGQWLTTWLSRDLPQWNKEDHWFAPALLIGDRLVRPAPLSARTAFEKTADGTTLPGWTLEWRHEGVIVRQRLFSRRERDDAVARVFVRFELRGATAGVRLALGLGRRPNVHYWDDRSRERTPLPFFTLEPQYRREGSTIVDAWNNVILASAQPFTLERLGPVEMLAVFEPDADGVVGVATPQAELATPAEAMQRGDEERAHAAFVAAWTERLARGAQVRLPSPAWSERIDAWRAQVEQITRVHYQGRERLSYGAYFYQAYFGIEEGWPPVALALWGRGDEAQRQVAIMLEPENLDKTNVHHQSRNGAGPTAAALVARLTHDAAWLESIAPALLECARWTQRVRSEKQEARSPLTRGLLPPHIYGGDVRDPATSLYATAACWRGLVETADVLRALGTPARQAEAAELAAEAERLRVRIGEVIAQVAARDGAGPFVPFALELPSLAGKNEGPHPRITATRFGNYWNLFAPSWLELRFGALNVRDDVDRWVFDYAQAHGGMWAGLPRFYDGLDAAYAIGYIGHLLDRAVTDPGARHRALAALQAFFLHAASRNGHAIPEVAGLFPERLDATAYERVTREAPWNFGMYDAERYLAGHISFTEPLGAGAGEALCLIRQALLSETRDGRGLPDGGLVLLPAVPGEWFAEGKEIALRDFPTAYGTLSATVRSRLASRREIEVEWRFTPFAAEAKLGEFRVRLAPTGERAVEVKLEPRAGGTVRVGF